MLRYYEAREFKGVIYIGDSSGDVERTLTLACIRELGGKLRIEHRFCSGCDAAEAMRRLLAEVTTPYVAFAGDDDFLVPSELERAALFLEAHPDHSLAHGVGAMVTVEGAAGRARIAGLRQYHLGTIGLDTAAERLIRLMGPGFFTTLFSVQRTETMRRAFEPMPLITDHNFKELFSVCLPIVEGKAKTLDGLYLVREEHPARYKQRTMVEWLTRSDFGSSYTVFHRLLTEAVAEQDGVPADVAGAIVEQAFHGYLARVIALKYDLLYGRSRVARLRAAARAVPLLGSTWRWLRAVVPEGERALSLQAIARSSSPYHASFMHVRNSLLS